jgi:hypothetical protein
LGGPSTPDTRFCVFVTPTIMRPTLAATLASVAAQTDGDVGAIVAVDGGDAFILDDLGLDDAVGHAIDEINPLIGLAAPKTGKAGLTRNHALEWMHNVEMTDDFEWTAFVDDDDMVSPRYVEWLRAAAAADPEMDVAIFRMHDPRWGVLPRVLKPEVRQGQVGISFAVRSTWWDQGLRFVAEENPNDPTCAVNEDIELLTELMQRGAKMKILPQIAYFVGAGR